LHLNPIAEAFAPLRELAGWNVRQGHGSFVTFEFGAPVLEIGEPRMSSVRAKLGRKTPSRSSYVRGAWHLWIYCCHWKMLTSGEELAWSEDDDRRIGHATTELNGQMLAGVSVNPSKGTSSFKFDLGGELLTWPYEIGDDEQWRLYEPDGRVLQYRADGCYARDPAEFTDAQNIWLPAPHLH
jgi:hypothetical protein